MLKRRYQGSFTVEAAFVMPILLMVIFGLIYLGFFLHDSLVIQMVMERNQKEAAEQIRHEGDLETKEIYYEKINKKVDEEKLERELESLIQQELKQHLFITELSEIKAKIGLTSIRVKYVCRLRISAGNLISLFRGNHEKKEESVMIYNPMKVIRSTGGITGHEGGI